MLRAFRSAYPSVELELSQQSIPAQLESLRRGSIDIGVLRAPVSDPHIRTETLFKEPFVVALPDNHPLTAADMIAPADLAEQSFVMVRGIAETFSDVIANFCAEHDFKPRVVQEASESATILGLVSAGFGLAVVPRSSQEIRVPGVIFRPLLNAPTTELILAWLDEARSGSLDAFVLIAKEILRPSS